MALKRMIVEVEILYDSEITNINNYPLKEMAEEIIDGHASGVFKIVSDEEVSKEKMAELLIAQGSSPEFLLGDEELDDEEE